jgi:protein-S-isoprenylcysteine O-methyltransferase Ste14
LTHVLVGEPDATSPGHALIVFRHLDALAEWRSAMGTIGQRSEDIETARPLVRPPLLHLACLVLGLVLDRVLALPISLPDTDLACWAAGGGLILLGTVIFAAAVSNFSRAATPVPSTQPVRTLVTTGVHGLSRNPIYVGMLLLYAGIGVAARSPWTLVLALPLAVVMRYGVVAREEAYLERRFGDAYREYKAHVRRWL